MAPMPTASSCAGTSATMRRRGRSTTEAEGTSTVGSAQGGAKLVTTEERASSLGMTQNGKKVAAGPAAGPRRARYEEVARSLSTRRRILPDGDFGTASMRTTSRSCL